jgi:TatD DNase family protein
MLLKYFDAHTHVNFQVFQNDYRQVIENSLKSGIGMINAGTQKQTSLMALKLAKEFKTQPVFASIGLHPLHTFHSYLDQKEVSQKDYQVEESFDFNYYFNLALDKKVVAIGECGLDFFRIESQNEEKIKNNQKVVFEKHLELSQKVKKPLVVHCRSALDELLKILTQNKNLLLPNPGVMHFFTGSKDQARQFLNLNFYFTFGGVITFSKDYDEVIKYLPLDKILTETDAPYVAPLPYRGKRNEPKYVVEVVKKIAGIKSLPLEKVERQIIKNAKIIFDLDFNETEY